MRRFLVVDSSPPRYGSSSSDYRILHFQKHGDSVESFMDDWEDQTKQQFHSKVLTWLLRPANCTRPEGDSSARVATGIRLGPPAIQAGFVESELGGLRVAEAVPPCSPAAATAPDAGWAADGPACTV
eukprot:g37007.t1